MEILNNWHPNRPVDLKNCHDEPIQIPGAIQEFGFLLGYEPESQIIRVASRNAIERFPELRRMDEEEILISSLVVQGLEKKHGSKRTRLRDLVRLTLKGSGKDQTYLGVIFKSGELEILEVETKSSELNLSNPEYFNDLPTMMADIHACSTLEDLAKSTAETLKRITSFDRVMVYRYDNDWNGEVIAEEKEPQLEAFLGLHYPASDIPAQARALYEKNWIRIIPTVYYTPSPLIPETYQSLDLSDSTLRSVSPIHIQYLKNMGVAASMSISLIVNGKLWGLVACHHYSNHLVNVDIRLRCEAYAQLVSAQIRALTTANKLKALSEGERGLQAVLEKFSESADFADCAQRAETQILQLFDCSGVVIRLGDEIVRLGEAPGEILTAAFAQVLSVRSILDPLASSEIGEIPNLEITENTTEVAGVMGLALAAKHNYYILCVRPEESKLVNWAGKPEKLIVVDALDPSQRLLPRGSFQLWSENKKGISLPWSESTVDIFKRFGLLFVKLVIEKKAIVDRSNNELRALNRAKDEFVAMVSHELRTPLNAIIGWSDLALSGELESDQFLEAMKIVQRNARSQNQLIGDLLDISRVISGKLKLSVRSIRISEIANAVVPSFTPAADAKGIRIISTLDTIADSVIGDPGRIQQVIWNLVSNAIKFSPKNSRIWITIQRVNSHIELQVKDQGIGIEPEFKDMIFGRFNQVDSTIGRRAGGLGLGLAIAKHIVELHGGTMMAESEGVGKGSTFTVLFPIAPVASDNGNDDMPIADEYGLSVRKAKVTTRLSCETILIAEDEPDAQAFLRILLVANGATVFVASNGVEALELLKEKRKEIGIILSDIGMPQMDGYRLLEAVRASDDPEISSVCAVALTAFASARDRILALKAGFDSYIAKPVMQEELLTVLESVCKSKNR